MSIVRDQFKVVVNEVLSNNWKVSELNVNYTDGSLQLCCKAEKVKPDKTVATDSVHNEVAPMDKEYVGAIQSIPAISDARRICTKESEMPDFLAADTPVEAKYRKAIVIPQKDMQTISKAAGRPLPAASAIFGLNMSCKHATALLMAEAARTLGYDITGA